MVWCYMHLRHWKSRQARWYKCGHAEILVEAMRMKVCTEVFEVSIGSEGLLTG